MWQVAGNPLGYTVSSPNLKNSQYPYMGILQCSIKQSEIANINVINKNHDTVTEVKQ